VRSPLSHARTFGLLRSHVLCDRPLTGDVESDRASLLAALRSGAAWVTCPFVAPAHGARHWAERSDGRTVCIGGEAPAGPATLRLRLPRPADVSVGRDGSPICVEHGAAVDLDIDRPGVYRVEARIDGRLWLLSNPIHLRPPSQDQTMQSGW
jgi:hypothetical protein